MDNYTGSRTTERSKFFALLVSLFVMAIISAQENENDSIPRFTDVFFPTGILDYDAEFYVIDSGNQYLEHHFILQPILSDVNIVNLEFGLTHSWIPEGNFTTPADMSVSYQRNFKAEKYGESGFQGLGARLKFIIPTGRGEFLSGLDSWTLEPTLVTGWLLNNPAWFLTLEARYNNSFAALPGKTANPDFFRFETFYGYEDDNWWFRLKADYRLRTALSEHNLFLGADGSLKVNKSIGLTLEWKSRVVGDNFWEHFVAIGGYYLF